jgi:hypothetical protein
LLLVFAEWQKKIHFAEGHSLQYILQLAAALFLGQTNFVWVYRIFISKCSYSEGNSDHVKKITSNNWSVLWCMYHFLGSDCRFWFSSASFLEDSLQNRS